MRRAVPQDACINTDRVFSVSVPGRVCVGENVDWMLGPVIVATLRDLRINIRVETSNVRGIFIHHHDGESEYLSPESPMSDVSRSAQYIKAVLISLEAIGCYVDALRIWIDGTLPSAGGLASSGAFCVALVTAIARCKAMPVSAAEAAERAFVAEREVLGIPCGQMDQFAVAIGGCLHLDCSTKPPTVTPLQWRSDMRLVVAWSGGHASFASFGHELLNRWLQKEPGIDLYANVMVTVIEQIRSLLCSPNWKPEVLGNLINYSHEAIVNHLGVRNLYIDHLVEVATRAGAYGAKSAGARPNGGAMFALCKADNADRLAGILIGEGAKASVSRVNNNRHIGR